MSNRTERARLNILQALRDLDATTETKAVRTKDVDHVVGDLSRYATSNTKTMQSLIRDNLIEIDFEASPLKIWSTSQGRDYLDKEA